MSRSIKGVIAFGKSTRGRSSRGKTWGDFRAEKLRKDGFPIVRQHYRHELQTKEDYITYVRERFNIKTFNDIYDRRRCEEYIRFLGDREETEELIIEFAVILYNKDKSK